MPVYICANTLALIRCNTSGVQLMRHLFYIFSSAVVLVVGTVFALDFSTDPEQPIEKLITLRKPVILSVEEQLFVGSLAPLKISSHEQAPPLSLYDRSSGQYNGISVDVFRFIADQIGLSYQFVSDGSVSYSNNMQQFEQGHFDVLIPASYSTERAQIGLFTDTHYNDFYSAIARREDRLEILNTQQLGQYRIGVIDKTAIVSYMQSVIPNVQLHTYLEGAIYEGLRRNKIDVALLNKGLFAQDRIRLELFDLDNIFTLYDFPRSYGFLFKRNADNQKLVDIFNRYLAAIDNTASVFKYENDEFRLIEKYIQKQHEQKFLLIVLVLAGVLLLLLLRVSLARKKILAELSQSHKYIVRQHQALQEVNQKLEYLSSRDGLTGLINRRHFDEQLCLEHARHLRTGTKLSVLMVDIDFFKKINDHYGHAMGDVYLQKIAAVLDNAMSRSSDLAARYGGEEFVCLLPDTDFPGALQVAEHIREAVIAQSLDNGEIDPQPITVSIGVATVDNSQASAHELLEQADMQLYRAKNNGRNRVCGVLLGGKTQATELAQHTDHALASDA